jgi:hypothetical protein
MSWKTNGTDLQRHGQGTACRNMEMAFHSPFSRQGKIIARYNKCNTATNLPYLLRRNVVYYY